MDAQLFRNNAMTPEQLDALYNILSETTAQLRNGDEIHGTPALVEAIKRGDDELPGGVVTIDAMPHESTSQVVEKIDMVLLTIGVDRAKAEARRVDLIAILDGWPNPDELASGPSYITAGAAIGDQGAAFQLFALGEVLGLWTVITPTRFGMEGEEARQAAGGGFIMITGYRPQVVA